MGKRFKDCNWLFDPAQNGSIQTWEQAQVAVLMDIRDELKTLNALLHCHNFTSIPTILRGIRTKIPAKKKAVRRA